MRTLGFEFFNREADIVAKELIGKVLVRNFPDGSKLMSRVVETEAYLGTHDLAAHTSKGRTKRTEVLFGPAGKIYVFLIYGIHHMLNVSTGPEGSAVLIRGLEPLNHEFKTKGPGLVAKYLQMTRDHVGEDVTSEQGTIYFADDGFQPQAITISKRIGVDYAQEWKDKELRYHLEGNKWVSK